MNKKFNYVYITTNLINGKQYVGDRTSYCDPQKDKYLGSGTYFKNAKRYYGIDKFSKTILELFDTKQDAFNAQEKYIKEYNTLWPNGYNISPKGGYGIPDSFLNEETKEKIKKALIGQNKQVYREYNKKYKKGKSYEEQMIQKYGFDLGIIKAKEYKEKISKSVAKENNPMYGKGYLIAGEKNGMYGKISPMRGVSRSEESKRKMSESKKGVKRHLHLCPYCNREISDGNYERWHGDNCKQNNKKISNG